MMILAPKPGQPAASLSRLDLPGRAPRPALQRDNGLEGFAAAGDFDFRPRAAPREHELPTTPA